MMVQVRFPMCVLAGLCLAAAGCGSKPVATKGVLTVAGRPLAGATVMFIPDEADGKSATGLTDANGAFELGTLKLKDGALPGSYKITIHYSEPMDIPKGLTPEEIQAAQARAPAKASPIPAAYARSDLTPLKHRVPQDGDAKLDVPRASD